MNTSMKMIFKFTMLFGAAHITGITVKTKTTVPSTRPLFDAQPTKETP